MSLPKNNEAATKVAYNYVVEDARKIAETKAGGDIIAITLNVNGVKISSVTLTEYQNKTGVIDYILTMPQRAYVDKKSNSTKYTSDVFVPVSKEARAQIVADSLKLLTEVK